MSKYERLLTGANFDLAEFVASVRQYHQLAFDCAPPEEISEAYLDAQKALDTLIHNLVVRSEVEPTKK